MDKLVGIALLAFFLVMPLAGPVEARQVFLADGGVLDCQSVKVARGNVVVLVNRDVLLKFSKAEVDMKRTFPHKAIRKSRKQLASRHQDAARPTEKPRPSAAAPPRPAPEAPAPQIVPVPAQKEIVAQPAALTPGRPSDKSTKQPMPHRPQTSQAATPAATPAGAPAGAPTGAPAATPAGAPAGAPAAASAPQPVAAVAPRVPSLPSDEVMKERQARLNRQMNNHVTSTVSHSIANIPFFILKGIWMFFILSPFGQFILLMLVLTLATFWKVFVKAGEEGWKGIIPIYNLFILMRIAGKPLWWVALLFVPVVGIIIGILYNLSLAERFGKSQLFGIGLLFLPAIFYGMLAFGEAEYH